MCRLLMLLCVVLLSTAAYSSVLHEQGIDDYEDAAQGREAETKDYRHWRWGHPKANKPENLYLDELVDNIPADERWMRSIDIPSLHLILDAYSSAVKKTGWIAKLGRTIQNRILQRMLKTQIRRFASSNREGPTGNDVEPRFMNPFALMPCVSSFTEPGLCLSSAVCDLVGGTEGGECFFGKTCCVINRVVTGCSANVVSNNTYWQSPPLGVDTGSLCVMTIPLNTGVIQQRYQPVCQVRIDFEIFSIAQPSASSECDMDYFRVSGATHTVPPICGDNPRQHMYLSSKSTANVIQLIVGIGRATNVDRAWRMKISLLPCYADYLAPPECLQYYTQSTGLVKSFNWKDVGVVAGSPRQLADQDYQICFRQETLNNNQIPRLICMSECTVTATGSLAFSLSGDSTAAPAALLSGGGATGVAANSCLYDFLLFAGGFDTTGGKNDRFCGNKLNPTPGTATSVSICSNFKPFRLRYVTNRVETDANSNPAQTDVANNGFCLSFVQVL